MRSNSKAVRDKVKKHILESVYDENENEFKSFDKASEYLTEEFKRVADYPNNKHRFPNDQERFTDYLRGIPFHFEYWDDSIEEFLNGLGINPKNKKFSSDRMWHTYGALIWREISPKYYKHEEGGSIGEHMGASDLETFEKGGKIYLVGGDLDHVMYQLGGSIGYHMGASDLESFEKGGLVKHYTRPYRDTDEMIDVYEVDLGSLNVGNNHTTNHLVEAIQESDKYEELIEATYNMVSNSELKLKYKDRFGNNYEEDFDSSEFNDIIAGAEGDPYSFKKGGAVKDDRPRLKRGDRVFMDCKRWFQSSYGNTYHSVDVYVNSELVGRLPFEYGYGDHCLTTGLRALWDAYKPPYKWSDRSESGTFVNSARKLKDYGIKFTYEIEDVERKRDLEMGGELEVFNPERDLIVPFGKGGQIHESIKSGTISEKEMKAIKRAMNNDKVDEEFREVIQHIWDETPSIDPDSEWSKKGLKFLMNQWKTPTGKERKNNPFGYREQEILKNFDRFDLAGFHDTSRYGGVSYFIPIYDVCTKDGWCFQYYYDGKVNIIGRNGGVFGINNKRSTHSIRMDRMWSSNEPHEVAYRPKRKNVKRSGADRKRQSQEPHEVAGRKKMMFGGYVNGTYGSGQTPAIVYTLEKDGGTWYAVDGSTGVNFTYDTVEDGVDVEELNDVDFFTSGFAIESEDDIERAVEE